MNRKERRRASKLRLPGLDEEIEIGGLPELGKFTGNGAQKLAVEISRAVEVYNATVRPSSGEVQIAEFVVALGITLGTMMAAAEFPADLAEAVADAVADIAASTYAMKQARLSGGIPSPAMGEA